MQPGCGASSIISRLAFTVGLMACATGRTTTTTPSTPPAASPPGVPAAPTSAIDDPMHALRDWAGSYACAGQFANGTAIASTVKLETDASTGTLIKHHDDSPSSGTYHALEVWVYQPDAKRFATTITDSTGDVRQLYSPGLQGTTLTWTNADPAAERFVYTALDHGGLQIDWMVGKGSDWKLGDTLTCHRVG
jgi:hypothetical protein